MAVLHRPADAPAHDGITCPRKKKGCAVSWMEIGMRLPVKYAYKFTHETCTDVFSCIFGCTCTPLYVCAKEKKNGVKFACFFLCEMRLGVWFLLSGLRRLVWWFRRML
jgi:hypothetical protein